ncbi:MAG: pheA [Planctomycetaceae bacterium]|nr:pheA [Planctomycetaceae bacterium]
MVKKSTPAKSIPTPPEKPVGKISEAPKKEKAGSQFDLEIQKLDREIVRLISKRVDATAKHWMTLPVPHKAMFEGNPEDSLAALINESALDSAMTTTVRSVFREILSGARGLVKMKRVAYLGPAYSYTHLAAIEKFGTQVDLVPVSTIASVFEEVNRGSVDYGIVPVENSTDGRIVDTLDMFTRLPLKICAEVQLSINHNLLARCPRSEVVEIYSKPQALSQCRDWLSRNMPQARLIEVTSTSTAAQLARDKHGAAAVASRQAAVMYELQVLAEGIQDNKHNVTRFAVIGDEIGKPSERDKTAILLQIAHKPGALADALNIFKNNKINLTWIESFPLKGPEAGYLFFVDFEGHIAEPRPKKALSELEKTAVRLEVLGSYPRSEPVE